MTNTDDPLTAPAPAPPPSYIRRHPILAGFAVLSGLSLFSALWPVSAIVITIAVAGHATGLDRAAWSFAEQVGARVRDALRGHAPAEPSPPPAPPEPAAPPVPTPHREAHTPSAPALRLPRPPAKNAPGAHRPSRTRRSSTSEPKVGTGIDGPGL